ncbi:MAG: hypothetical protein AAF721_18635 [Myxococcota bacterium]
MSGDRRAVLLVACLLGCAGTDDTDPPADGTSRDGASTRASEDSEAPPATSTTGSDGSSEATSALDTTAAVGGSSTGSDLCDPARTEVDRPDDTDLPQVHVVYALPSDGRDRGLDTNGTLAASVEVWNAWLADRAGGDGLRIDTCGGDVDVTFFVLDRTDAEVAAEGAYVREEIEAGLEAAGRIEPHKLYAVYYDGSSTYACGGGAFPPALVGRVGALYLRGTPPGAPRCPQDFAAPGGEAGYLEHAMLHELLHSIGLVATCGATSDGAGHATDDPSDLMYSGPRPWFPTQLDPGNDDYWLHDDPDCPDLEGSALRSPMPDDAWFPEGW